MGDKEEGIKSTNLQIGSNVAYKWTNPIQHLGKRKAIAGVATC